MNIARVIKTDSSTDKIELKGLQITKINNNTMRKVTVTYWTDSDFTTVTSGTYTWVASFIGDFTRARPQQGGTPLLTTSCSDPNGPGPIQWIPPCARLRLFVNGNEKNDWGPDGTKAVAIPCKNGQFNPCARFGGKTASSGTFDTYETKSYATPNFDPQHTAILHEATFTVAEQTLVLKNSGVVAMSNVKDEEFGVEDVFYSLADELGGNSWVHFSQGSEGYRAVPEISGGKVTDPQIRIAFGLEQSELVPANKGVTLTSIVTDPMLRPLEQARNDRSYVSYIAPLMKLTWDEVTKLILEYDYVAAPAFSDDTRIGKLKFSDCAHGSFRVRVALVSRDGLDAGTLNIYLGSTEQFKAGCAAVNLSKKNLMSETDDSAPRVDATTLHGKFTGPCCMTVKESKAAYGELYVRSISVVVDQGGVKPIADYKVELSDASVNGIGIRKFLLVPGKLKPVDYVPTEGRSIVITKLTGAALAPLLIDNAAIIVSKNQLQATVPISELAPDQPENKYRVELCLLGGLCIPDQATFTVVGQTP
jgi:hypothetical protein